MPFHIRFQDWVNNRGEKLQQELYHLDVAVDKTHEKWLETHADYFTWKQFAFWKFHFQFAPWFYWIAVKTILHNMMVDSVCFLMGWHFYDIDDD